MATRDVIVRLFGDDKDLAAKLKEADLKLSEFARANPTAKLGINAASATTILDSLKLKLTEYGHLVETARLKVDDAQAIAELDRIELKMAMLQKHFGSLGKKMDLTGLARARVLADDIGKSLGSSLGTGGTSSSGPGFFRRLLGRLGGLGNGGRGGSSDPLAALGGGGGGGAGGVGSGLLSSLGGASNAYTGAGIGGLIAILGSIAPAIIPLALGGGVGLGGTLLASSLGSSGASKIAADKYALQKALAGSSSASNRLTIAHDRAQLAKDQGLYGGFAPFGKSVSALGRTAMDTLAGAFSSKGAGGAPSFLQGLTTIFKQLGPEIRSLGPMLGQLFRASLPFISAFAKELGPLAKTLFPALTQSMKQLTPFLPQLMQGFTTLAQGVASFIKDLGPGMKNATVVFKALMVGVKGILIGLAYTFDFLALVFRRFGHNVSTGVSQIIGFFKRMYHESIANWHAFENGVKAVINAVVRAFDQFKSMLSRAWNAITRDVSSAWNSIKRVFTQSIAAVWAIFSAGVGRLISLAASIPGKIVRALGNLGSLLFQAGRNVIQGLINGITSMIGSIGSAMGGIASTIRSFLPFSPAKKGPLSGSGSPDIAGRKVASMLASGIQLGSHEVSAAAHGMALTIPAAFGSGISSTPMRGGAYGVNPGGAIQITVSGQESDLVKAIVKSLRYEIRSNGGGNVQAHLGWGSA